MKEDVLISMLVLNVKRNEVVGFDTNNLEMLSVRKANVEKNVSLWQTVEFKAGAKENGWMLLQEDSDLTVMSSPPENGVRRSKEGAVRIPTLVVFSSNCNHLSFNKNVAVSDRYGYIALQPSEEQFDANTLYSVEIFLDQITDPRKPTFKAATRLEAVNLPTPDYQQYLLRMHSFEDRKMIELRDNLGATEIPHSRDLERKEQGTPRNATNTYHTALFYEIDTDAAVFWTKQGDAILVGNAVVASTGESLRMGDWVEVRLEERRGCRYVERVVERSQADLPMTKRFDSGREQVYVTGDLELTVGPEQESMGARFYKHPVLGLVEVHQQFYQQLNSRMKVEFEKTSKAPVIQGEQVFWIVHRIIQDTNSQRVSSVQEYAESSPRFQEETTQHSTSQYPVSNNGFVRSSCNEMK